MKEQQIQTKKIKELENTLDEQKKAISTVLEKSKQIADIANMFFTIQSEGKSDIKDPRISSFVSVLEVRTSKDLNISKIYISVLGDVNIKNKTLKALNSA